MNAHPYLRAYLGGVFVPTLVLPLLLAVFIVARIVLEVPVPIEQGMIFPMAVVPSLFGLWNMLYLASHLRNRLPIGVHGALLPVVMAPIGGFVATSLGVLRFGSSRATWFHVWSLPYPWIALGFLAGMAGYYLVWKYIVGFVNRVLGIA